MPTSSTTMLYTSSNVKVPNGTTTLSVTVHRHRRDDDEDPATTKKNGQLPPPPPNENENGSGEETVILLHGGPGFPDDFEFVVDVLLMENGNNNKTKRYYQVVTFDQRGLGDSSCPENDHHLDSYVEDLVCIAKHLKVQQFHLWGQSWGGCYAQIFAQAHPHMLKSLFLSSPSSGTNSTWKETESEVLQYNRDHCESEWQFLQLGLYSLGGMLGWDWCYQRMYRIVVDNYMRDFHGQPQAKLPPPATPQDVAKVKAAAINAVRPQIVSYPPLRTMPNLEFPTMIVYGDRDIYGPTRDQVRQRYPAAELVIIEQCGHLPWYHNPARYQQVLEEFYLRK